MNRAASALGIEEPVGKADLSAVPDLTEIAAARILRAPTPGDPASTIGASEQPALSKALASYAREGGQFNPQNLTLLDQHLNSFSDSPLRATLLLEKAELCKRNGHFVKALDAFELVWNENKNLTNNDGIRMAERALKEVLFLASHLGQKQTLTRLISEVKERDLGGDATEAVFKAHEALWFLNNRAERNIFCGFTATNLVCVPQGDPPIFPDVHNETEKKAFIRDGLSLFELRAHSLEEGGSLRIFKRSKGSPLVVPSVIHWVFNHYSAVTEQKGDLYRIQDPHLRFDGWITREFLEEQTSGYLLVSGKTQIPKSYAKVSDKEAKGVFGRHCVHARDDEGDDCTKGGNYSSCAMATYSFRMLNPGLVVTDTPITHQPAYGPAVNIRVVYDQRSTVVADRSADYANFGPQWTHGLNAYVVKVGTGPVTSPNSSVRAVRGDGVYYQYSNLTNSNNYSNPKFADRPQLVFVPGTAGIRGYKLLYPDGSEELYTKADGISETRYFLTKVTDTFGKALSIQYDTSLRITSVVDALNGVTTFSYTPAAGDGVPTDTFKIRSITDPFNRKAQFAYDASGRLRKIVDPMGITSEFRYGKNDFIEQVITPYGVAIFQTGDLPGINEEPGRFIEAVDPYGNRERMEANDFAFGNKYGISELAMVNEETGNRPPPTSVRVGTQDVPFLPKVANLHYRNTFYWDKKQMAYHAGDYSMATIYNWLTVTDDKITSVLASVKKPLEGRVWFNYPGQTSEHSIGKTSMPSKVVRAVEQADGSLVYTMEQLLFEQSGSPGVMANGYGFPVGKVDAEGRRVRYQFASNQLDLTAVEVDENGAWRTLYSFSNYLNRLPQTVSDASGLARNYTYNPAGQVTQIVTSKGTASEITRFFYKRIPGVDVFLSGSGDGDGYLMRVEQSVAGGTFVPIAEFTYDAALRVRQAKDVDKYTLKYDYDNFDRVTLITHPDSTTEQFVYDKLDLHAEKDRGGLWTRTFYNSLRQPVVTQDPKGRFTTLEWCRCGSLSKVIDPMGKTTWWKRDSQGRVTEKLMPDGVTATRYQYQPKSGRLASVTMPNNAGQANTVAYVYSLGGQLLKEDYADPATPDVSYRYDDFMARLTSHADGLGTTNYAYHPLIGAVPGAGMLQSINGPRTDDTLRYGYDWHSRLSRRELVTDSGSILRSEEVLFDSLGRADLVTNQLGAFDLVYNAGNNGPRVDAVVAPNGLRTDFTYHPLSATGGKALLLSGISHSRNGSALASFTYDYDPSGRITTWGRNLGGVAGTWAFEYSRASELTGATLKNATGQVAKSMRYLYDGSGNRVLNGVDSTAKYARYNNLNQLGKIGGAGPAMIEGTVDEPSTVTVNGVRTETVQVPGTQTWRFERQIEATEGTNTVSIVAKDAQNNTRSDQWQFSVGPVEKTLLYDANGNLNADGARTLTWDTRDRLTSVTIDGVSYSWEYDGMDRRIRELRNGVLVKQWIWDGLEIIQERDGTGAITKTFYQQGVVQGGASYFYTRDHLGSIREMIDASGGGRARYDYDLWGQREKLAGDLEADLGYTGHFTHQGAKMVMAPFRQYDAALGRWLSRDPIGEAGGLNLYGYVGNDPINAFDGDGLSTVRINGQTVLVDPTNQQFRETIKSCPDGSIRNLEITGHGSRYAQEIGKGATPQGLIWYPGVSRAIQFDDDASFLKDLLAPKMSKGGNIDLRGCNTAREWYLFGDGQNITRQLSVELPDVSVTGSRGFTLGNEWNAPWDHDIGFRIGRENHALVRTWRTYLNGK